MIRTCLYCGKEFESSQGWICDRKYCSKECGNTARRIKYYEERKNRICKQCGKPFVYSADTGSAWFCSIDCRKRWNYEQSALKKVHEEADSRCAEWLQNGVQDNFTVLSEWTEGDGNVEIEIRCNDCGGTFKKQIYLARRTKHCPLCWKRSGDSHPRKYGNMDDYKAVLEAKRQESLERKEKEREERKQAKICEIEQRIFQKQQFEQEQLSVDRICKNCGNIFHSINSHIKYCSPECAKKMSRSRGKTKRRLRIDENYIEDVSLEKLYERDGGICYLCGRKTNYNDYEIKDDVFIAGNWYPSIDHIVPLCEGGEHSYKNTKLAHRICNSLRYVKEKKAQ